MAPKPWNVQLRTVPNKWVTFLTHLHNRIPHTYQCVFPNAEVAKQAHDRMTYAIERNPWLKLVLFRKGNVVYVVKTDVAQEVIIEDV